LEALITPDFLIAFTVVFRIVITDAADIFLGHSAKDARTVLDAIVSGVVVTDTTIIFSGIAIAHAGAVPFCICTTAPIIVLGRIAITDVIAVELCLPITNPRTIPVCVRTAAAVVVLGRVSVTDVIAISDGVPTTIAVTIQRCGPITYPCAITIFGKTATTRIRRSISVACPCAVNLSTAITYAQAIFQGITVTGTSTV
jgi:hypothetical protein